MSNIQKMIDKVVPKEGLLRISSWWMRKILSDLVQYCENMDDSTQISELRKEIEGLRDNDGNLLNGIASLALRVKNLEDQEMFQIVAELPSEPQENIIYLVPSVNAEELNFLTEWIYINGSWEQFGEFKADVDLSEYTRNIIIDAYATGLENSLKDKYSKLMMGEERYNVYARESGRLRFPCAVSTIDGYVELEYLNYKNGYLYHNNHIIYSTGSSERRSRLIGKETKVIELHSYSQDLMHDKHIKLIKGSYDSCLIRLSVGQYLMYEEYSVEYNASEITVRWPENIRWENRTPPTANAGSTFIVRIVRSGDSYWGSFVEYPRPFITFKIDSNEIQGEDGMTWEEWVGSSYNTINATTSSDGAILVDEKLIVIGNTLIASTETIIAGTEYELQAQMSNEEKLVGTYNHSATSTGGATLGTAYLPTIAIDSSGNFTMSSLLGNSSSGPVANATYDGTAKTFTVLKGWTHPMFGPVDVDIVFDVDFNSMTLTAKSDFTVGGWATISGYKLVKKS